MLSSCYSPRDAHFGGHLVRLLFIVLELYVNLINVPLRTVYITKPFLPRAASECVSGEQVANGTSGKIATIALLATFGTLETRVAALDVSKLRVPYSD